MYGVMLDTADKTGRSLRSIMQEDALRSFVHTSKAHGLMTGLAGSLQVSDIQPLLGLKPDYLGFRGALCSRGQRQMEIDVHAARRVRALIPANNYHGLSPSIRSEIFYSLPLEGGG
jgi:dihydroneopterin aldolase